MRTSAASLLLAATAMLTACSSAEQQEQTPRPTSSSQQEATPTSSMETVAQYYARGGGAAAGTDGEALVDETAQGTNEYALPDISAYGALTVGFTCDAEAGIEVQIGAVDQPGSYAGGAQGCVGTIGALTTPALDPAQLPHTVTVTAPESVEVSIAVYGVPRAEAAF